MRKKTFAISATLTALLFILIVQSAALAAETVSLNANKRVSLTNRYPDQTRSSIPTLRISFTHKSHQKTDE